MAAFQRAYADLAASPALCLAVRDDPDGALAAYELEPRERGRLAQAVWQRGMDANCTLYRATRIAALHSVLPLALEVLRPTLRALLDTYWESYPLHEVRFAREAARFVGWLERRADELPEPGIEIITLARRELASNDARLVAAGS